MSAKTYLAVYKGKKSGKSLSALFARAVDAIVRRATRSPYSHCEIAIAHGAGYICYSASARDGGVRRRVMPLPPEKWDLIPLPAEAAERAERLYAKTRGQRYDWHGAAATVLPIVRPVAGRWFCSEWCAAALDLPDYWRHTPETLAASAALAAQAVSAAEAESKKAP